MKMTRTRLNYKNKIILAPMVRVGTLPMRLLALDFGADIVYSEELIDWKLLKSIRRENPVLGTIDYVDMSDGSIVFRTCTREKEKIVVQLGTCDPDRALEIAKKIENDVAGIDINMGCPKEFSLKGGMGAALLTQPEKAKAILTNLTKNIKIPVTCKIRVLNTDEETLNLVKELTSTGIEAIAIHGRTKQERPQHLNRNETIKFVAKNIPIPVIANGGSREIEKFSDILKFRDQCGSSSVMIARSAASNCSIFNKSGKMLELEEMIVKYLYYAINYDNSPSNTKYCIQYMLKELQETPKGKKFLECQTLEQICSIWNLGDYCRQKQLEFKAKGMIGRREVTPDMFGPKCKKIKIDNDNDDTVQMKCAFIRVNYPNDADLPKTKLIEYCRINKINLPKYEIINENKLFRSIASFDGKKYTSTFWEKNKRFAEQGAALVLACSLGLITKDELIKNGSILE